MFGILDRDAGLRGLLARSPETWGPAQRLKCWSEDGNRLSWNCTAPPSKVSSGLGVMVAGSRPQDPVGQVSRGLGARPPGLGARPTRGLGPFPHKNHPNLSNYDFFANLLVGPGEGVGVG